MITVFSTMFSSSILGAADALPTGLLALAVISSTLVLLVLGFMGQKLAQLSRTVRELESRLASASQTSAASEPVTTRATAPEPQAMPSPAPAAVSEPALSMPGLPTTVAVVIAAAVAATLGRAARVIAVAEVTDTVRPWSLEGRRQIFASRSPR